MNNNIPSASQHHLNQLKQLIKNNKNISQQAYDSLLPKYKRLICFQAGLQNKHVNVEFKNLLVNERKAIIRAMNEIKVLNSFFSLPLDLTDSQME